MRDDDHLQPFAGSGWQARRLTDADAPAVQRFFDANPAYALLAYGHPWAADEAARELRDLPPAEFPQGRTHFLGIKRTGQGEGDGALLAFVTCTDDLFAEGVFHLGFLIVDGAQHGTGFAQAVLDALLAWACTRGAEYLRLGVLEGNARAAAFWQRQGLQRVRQRHDMPYGACRHTVNVLMRPLAGGSLGDYLSRVARDRPE